MCSPFSCSSFYRKDGIDEPPIPCTTPKESKRSRSYSKRRDSKSPFANQGLDKFNELLTELEEKRRKIYTQKGSEDISYMYFTASNSDNWRPIIVKGKKQEHTNANNGKAKQIAKSSETLNKHTIEASGSAAIDKVRQSKEEPSRRPKTRSKNWRHVFGFFPVTIVLILLFLTVFGRSFAIICTTLGWYLIPMMKEKSSTSERPKKMEYVRRLSETNMVKNGSSSPSPKSVLSGPSENPPGPHTYWKSW